MTKLRSCGDTDGQTGGGKPTGHHSGGRAQKMAVVVDLAIPSDSSITK